MVFWFLAIVIGCIAGFLVPAAWWAIAKLSDRLDFYFGAELTSRSIEYAIGYPLIAALFVFILIGVFSKFRSADAFTYFISDLHFQDGRRKLPYSIAHALSNLALLMGKGVVGIEGFGMEVLSAIGSKLGQLSKLSANQIRTLAACGATASIAAVIGQPAAAFLFIIELLYGWGSLSFTVGAYALTAFVAGSVAQSLTAPSGIFKDLFGTDAGLSLLIQLETYDADLFSSLLSIPLVSVTTAAIAALTIWLHKRTDQDLHYIFEPKRNIDQSKASLLLRLSLWIAVTAFALYFYPGVAGNGIAAVRESFLQGFFWGSALLFVLMRILLSSLAYSVIGSMGLVFPVMIIGVLTGNFITLALASTIPLSSGFIAILSLGGVFSACFGTPIAATALVFGFSSGMTQDNAVFLFVSLSINFLSHYLCGYLQKDRMASMGLYRHGIRFRNGMCFNTLSGIQVRDAMITYVNPVDKESSLGATYKKLMASKFSKLPVVGKEGSLEGVISLADFYGLEAWKRLGEDSHVHDLVGVEDMLKKSRVVVKPEMNLETALFVMSDEEIVPVVEENKYVGLLIKSDLVNLYNKEVVKKAFRRT
ncbi:MAG: chloride channel protein [Oligoflexia bacterium]|nr:chloride channel protein [Oligoflexia bacterium]